ncbi:hypothetical protein C5745_05960 [Sphingobacterium haloxyli]|uniref:histidine kinase n=2 Tax=Sphingobacterium haloxyli TaxID=2100533 RepID=A0A2S9J5M2_9SPHI|nr:hypothetical protein C5745_05960 [Sphingobacterium haloxyli]
MALWQKEETIIFWIIVSLFFISAILICFFWLFYRYQQNMYQQKVAHLENEHRFKESLRLSMLESQENERARIAHDLHDSLNGHLTALQWSVDLDVERPKLQDKIKFCIAEVRRISHNLYPPLLEDTSLETLLSHQVQHWISRYEIDYYIDVRTQQSISNHVKLHFLRIIQELFVNSDKHGHATRVRLHLRITPASLCMAYCDNGKGLPPGYQAGLGIKSIQNRIMMIAGQYKTKSYQGFQFISICSDNKHLYKQAHS